MSELSGNIDAWPLSPLVDTLCGLSCMRGSAERGAFVDVLQRVHRLSVQLRGVSLREDVVQIVLEVKDRAHGVDALVDTVAMFCGSEDAERVARHFGRAPAPGGPANGVLHTGAGDEGPAVHRERGLGAVDPRSPAPPQDGDIHPGDARPWSAVPYFPEPLTPGESHSARALLEKDQAFSDSRLADLLARELDCDIPVNLSAGQLLSRALLMNAQPDGLPPAVILLELAADCASSEERSGALRNLVEGWAHRHSLDDQLAFRRRRRSGYVPDHTTPRCLVVVVDPALDGSDDIAVQYWVNSVPGYWNPQQGTPVMTKLDGLAEAVQEALRDGVGRWSELSGSPQGPPDPVSPYIEFVLPYSLLNHDVAGLHLSTGDGAPLPLSPRYSVHVRSLERMRAGDPLQIERWRTRWSHLRHSGPRVFAFEPEDACRLAEWQMRLALQAEMSVVFVDAPAEGADSLDALKCALAEGVGCAAWDRRGGLETQPRTIMSAVLAAAGATPLHLPDAVQRFKKNAVLRPAPHLDFAEHLVLFWDDPHRLVGEQHIVEPEKEMTEE
ncbi:hypothetical protein ABZ464_02065 [Streptomyces sp. NPDC005820]|uniref:VMAP-C domain-containing protein n=1 Tax=Streptomyces sp. NPDC005820 TaxID=3157069 RepID=UPI0033DF52C1